MTLFSIFCTISHIFVTMIRERLELMRHIYNEDFEALCITTSESGDVVTASLSAASASATASKSISSTASQLFENLISEASAYRSALYTVSQ